MLRKLLPWNWFGRSERSFIKAAKDKNKKEKPLHERWDEIREKTGEGVRPPKPKIIR
ncbi:MAG: hypothetical protein ABH854_00800 [Candidatus Diapherotrites archaeon]|nr:hypothetical protein [Candidatus Micrarchaeota archaeon]MBU1940035.1 hypothetical protein [Candidatus Micrarchaeota archaeon]